MISNISINLPVSSYTGKESLQAPTVHESGRDKISLPVVKSGPDISEEVLMDLKDVQNFLFMITGTDLKADTGRSGKSTNIDFVA